MNTVRGELCLDGVWRCCPDFESEGESLGFPDSGFDDRLWREAAVPCTLEAACPGLEGFQRPVWFRRPFSIPAEWTGRRVVLRFEGVNDHAQVWLDGEPLGTHDDPFLPFEFELGPAAGRGDRHVLAVRVHGEARPDDVPGAHTGWRRYAGILRPVRLIATDRLRVEEPRIHADPASGVARVRARIVNGRPAPASFSAEVAIVGPDGTVAARASLGHLDLQPGAEAAIGGAATVSGCRPWSPDDPAVYRVRIRLREGSGVADEVERTFGFRRIEATPGGLRLNGAPIFLTGFNRHEDSPRMGMAEDIGQTRRDLERMKEAGANFVRLCHYPHAASELDLCDELGLAALAEVPLYFWNDAESGLRQQAARERRAARQLEAMIARDAHHPCVLFWSVSNETEEQHPEVAESNRRLIRLARAQDPSRLAVHVSNHWVEHPCFEEDDVICVNYYPSLSAAVCGSGSGYDGSRAAGCWREGLERLHARFPDKPVLVTEFGGCSFEGTFGTLFGEDRHARVLETEFAAFDAPYVCGAAVWCWADHAWPPGRFNGGLAISPYGVLTRDRRQLAPFHAARRMFRARQGLPETGPAGRSTAVLMIRPHMRDLPEPVFPEGYGIRSMTADDVGLWTDIEIDAEPFIRIEPDLFRREFGSDPEAWPRRCFILTDPRGLGVGTISAWYNRDFRGADAGRIHWVAVRRSCQGKGLGRAGLAYAMQALARWHTRAYLATSTERVGAIKLYLDFGFEPDLVPDGARDLWGDLAGRLSHPLLERALGGA